MTESHSRLIYLSTLPSSPADRKAALFAVAGSLILFVATVPFARIQFPPVPAFIASYQSSLAVVYVVTSVLLLSQFSVLRSTGILYLACGYLFTAIAVAGYALTYDDLFADDGLFFPGPETTVWLYFVWHAGFPVFALLYAISDPDSHLFKTRRACSRAIVLSILGVCLGAAILLYVLTVGHAILPQLIVSSKYSLTFVLAIAFIFLTCLLSIVILIKRSRLSVLDLWMMAILCAWIFEISLSAVFNAARFDFGYYAGRVYGLFAAGSILAILLTETAAIQLRLSLFMRQQAREAESELKRYAQRERLYSAAVRSSNDAIITESLAGTITGWNQAAERLFGFLAIEAVGQSIDIIVPADRHDEVRDIVGRIRTGIAIEGHETIRKAKDGRLLDVSLSVSPILSASGDTIGAAKVVRDISERKHAERALRESERMAQRILDTALDGFLQFDAGLRVTDLNRQTENIFGWTRQDAVNASILDIFATVETDSASWIAFMAYLGGDDHGTTGTRFEIFMRTSDGRDVTVELSLTKYRRDSGMLFNAFIRDVTEQRAAEAQFRQVQKMEAIGQLTGGVAHDFNNILTVITGTIEILAAGVADRPELYNITQMIDSAATRGAELTQHLLAFSRKQPLRPRDVDVNSLALETVRLLRPTLGEQIKVNLEIFADTWAAVVDPSQLTTAILNLALNARDAMPLGGTLNIRTRNLHLDRSNAPPGAEMVSGDYVVIEVSDTGTGMDRETLSRAVEPFFTTKDVGKGTGLGLSMVYGFVKQSKGHVTISSVPEVGTSVSLHLPRSLLVEAIDSKSDSVDLIQRGKETILIVEDDALVRAYVVAQIKGLGYQTLSAIDAVEAQAVIDSAANIDLLFTDVVLPGSRNGRQIAEEAVKRRPGLKVLFTSGYTQDAFNSESLLDSDVLLLAKPYRLAELAKMIRRALAA